MGSINKPLLGAYELACFTCMFKDWDYNSHGQLQQINPKLNHYFCTTELARTKEKCNMQPCKLARYFQTETETIVLELPFVRRYKTLLCFKISKDFLLYLMT